MHAQGYPPSSHGPLPPVNRATKPPINRASKPSGYKAPPRKPIDSQANYYPTQPNYPQTDYYDAHAYPLYPIEDTQSVSYHHPPPSQQATYGHGPYTESAIEYGDANLSTYYDDPHHHKAGTFAAGNSGTVHSQVAASAPPVESLPVLLSGDVSFLSEFDRAVMEQVNVARCMPHCFAEQLQVTIAEYDDATGIRKRPGKTPLKTSEGTKAVWEAISVLHNTAPLKPLVPSRGMSMACHDHCQDMRVHKFCTHKGSDGSTVSDRLNKYGKWFSPCSENLAFGSVQPFDVVASWIIDDGVPSRGHRNNILNPKSRMMGLCSASHPKFTKSTCASFAGGFTEKPEKTSSLSRSNPSAPYVHPPARQPPTRPPPSTIQMSVVHPPSHGHAYAGGAPPPAGAPIAFPEPTGAKQPVPAIYPDLHGHPASHHSVEFGDGQMYSKQLAELEAIGYRDRERNLALLRENGGNLNATKKALRANLATAEAKKADRNKMLRKKYRPQVQELKALGHTKDWDFNLECLDRYQGDLTICVPEIERHEESLVKQAKRNKQKKQGKRVAATGGRMAASAAIHGLVYKAIF